MPETGFVSLGNAQRSAVAGINTGGTGVSWKILGTGDVVNLCRQHVCSMTKCHLRYTQRTGKKTVNNQAMGGFTIAAKNRVSGEFNSCDVKQGESCG